MLPVLAAAAAAAAAPATMRAVKAKGLLGCKAPDFSCVVVETVDTPAPKDGQALVRVNASSVNPSDVDLVETPAAALMGVLGSDVSGTVVACPGCKTLKVGDEVWGGGGGMSDYSVHNEGSLGLKPGNLALTAAGTIPEVGLTSLFSLKRTGAPWTQKNLTVVVTSGSGGTGFIGIQMAKAFGAAHVVTATSGADNIAFVKSLGADIVTDYKVQDIFAALPDDSVDIVYDNYGADGTADKALHAIRSGGMYLLMPHGECFLTNSQKPPCVAKTTKPGVTQINYKVSGDSLAGLNEMKELFEAGKLVAHVEQTYPFEQAAAAYAKSATGTIVGKIAVTA